MQKWKFHKGYLASLVILFCMSNTKISYAQQDTIKTTRKDTTQIVPIELISGTIGIGGSSLGFPMFNTGLAFQKNKHIYSLRYIFAEEAIEALALYPHSEPLEKISEFGFSYGIEKTWTHRFSVSIGGGISYVQGIKRGKYVYTEKAFFGDIKQYETIQFKSPGLIMDAKITLLLSKYFNFSLNGFADLNIYKSFFGIALGMNFNVPFNKK